ncbi:chromate efflux transporter [Vibrio sp. VB16]|uniref:chromate efflux transporter n=1 Tax=Vibrio sp. VB16 TaxID=2785746 RepID=UPI00189DF466|nr:chromate efflux transporter [Vibrio sp. VB16]UGA56318.1 chromate efflux transporter [Vibrio sp. VB16]
MWLIFKLFFILGWVSFGGPAAHIGYFRQTFVEKHKWLDDKEYAQIVALSQFLPGPGSSQVGFALGYKKGGVPGACAAFVGFTLPSMLIMLGLATASSQIIGTSVYQGIVHGLKLLAVVVVADATWGMYKNFCKTKLTAGICVATTCSLLILPGISTQMAALFIAALIGGVFMRTEVKSDLQPFKASIIPLVLFMVLLIGLPLISHYSPMIDLFGHFYQAGSFVFGGGHVVLPLLQSLIGEQVSQDVFMTGYAAAQAVPGPMFTLATYIGYQMSSSPILGALVATLAVFLPGFLLLLAVLKNWQRLAGNPKMAGAILGVNASVVGLLLSALYYPIFSGAITSSIDVAIVAFGFYFYKSLNLSVLWMIMYFLFAGMLL